MTYFKRLKFFSPKQIIQVIQYSILNRILNRIPVELIKKYELIRQYPSLGIKNNGNMLDVNVEVNGNNQLFSLLIKSSDLDVFKQIILLEEYKIIIDLFKRYRIQPLKMVDAGANIGLTSIYFKNYYPHLSIYSLEPFESTSNRLKNNITNNNIQGIEVVEKGLWNRKTTLVKDTTFRDKMDWSHRLVESNVSSEDGILVVSMQDIMSEMNWDSIDFVKIDIEGGELEVFQGDMSWLEKVKMIAVEIHDEFDCRFFIEDKMRDHFKLIKSGELTIGISLKICDEN